MILQGIILKILIKMIWILSYPGRNLSRGSSFLPNMRKNIPFSIMKKKKRLTVF